MMLNGRKRLEQEVGIASDSGARAVSATLSVKRRGLQSIAYGPVVDQVAFPGAEYGVRRPIGKQIRP